ncbi:unnamed protein product, partial [Didymodactylos carnosus]
MCLCLKQHNGYYACSNCLQRGDVLQQGSSIVYYPYQEKEAATRTHDQFLEAAREARLQGGMMLGRILCIGYMHLCCSGHIADLLFTWFSRVDYERISHFIETV